MTVADLNAGIATGMTNITKMTKGMQSQALIAKGLQKLLGKDLLKAIIKLKQWGELWNEVFGESTEVVEELGEATEVALGPLTIFFTILKAMATTILFLIGLFALTAAALIYFGGSVAGGTAIFPEFFGGLESIKGSLEGVMGHLETVAGLVGGMNWQPMIDMAKMVLFGIIGFLMSFAVAWVDSFEVMLGAVVGLLVYMNDAGHFDTIMGMVYNLGLAFVLTFVYIKEILGVFGISFASVFGLINTIFIGFVDFCINSGLIDVFVKIGEVVFMLLPIFVIVIGEGLVLFAKILAYVGGPVVKIFLWAFGLIMKVVTFVFKVIAVIIIGFLDLCIWAFEGVVSYVSGEWTIMGKMAEIWDSIKKIVSDAIMSLINGLIDLGAAFIDAMADFGSWIANGFSSLGDDFYDGLTGGAQRAFDWIEGRMDKMAEIWDGIKEMVSDAIMALINGLNDLGAAFIDAITDFSSWIADGFSSLGDDFYDGLTGGAKRAFDWIEGNMPSMPDWMKDVGGLGGKAKDLLFASGGIASGPTSGYPVTLHGTEAVVPLPDGQSIPVTLSGMGGGSEGDTMNLAINVSGGGNAREIAREVSKEVQRAFRSRSRGNSFGRGVI